MIRIVGALPLVRLVDDKRDGRAKLVVFGPRGHEALHAAWRALQASEDRARQILGDSDLNRLRTSLELLLRHHRTR